MSSAEQPAFAHRPPQGISLCSGTISGDTPIPWQLSGLLNPPGVWGSWTGRGDIWAPLEPTELGRCLQRMVPMLKVRAVGLISESPGGFWRPLQDLAESSWPPAAAGATGHVGANPSFSSCAMCPHRGAVLDSPGFPLEPSWSQRRAAQQHVPPKAPTLTGCS